MYSEPTIEPIYDLKQNQYEEVYNDYQNSVRGSEIQPLPEEEIVEQSPAPVVSPVQNSQSLEAKAKIEEISKGLI